MSGIDGSAAHLSDGLFTVAIATYALAMVGYTAEFAFGRVATKLPAVAAKPARQLVGAGGPPLDEQLDGDGESTPLDESAGVDVSKDLTSNPPETGKRTRADRIGRWSVIVTIIAVLINTASIAVRAVAVDSVPWSNMYEFASVAGLIGVVAFLAVIWRLPQLRFLGAFVLLPVVGMMFLAGTVLYSQATHLVPALQSYWLAIHVTLVSIAEGAMMTSAVLTALYLVKSHHDSRSTRPDYKPGYLGSLSQRLPAAESLDKAAYRIIAFSFPLYTIAIICGAIWAESAWGRYWSWDPKETWAFIVWVIYAGYLHARATAGWKGRAAGWVNLAGFFAITFNFFIVNIVISGLHSYAGLPS